MFKDLRPYGPEVPNRAKNLSHLPPSWQSLRLKYVLAEVDRRGEVDSPLLTLSRTRGLVRQSDHSDKAPAVDGLSNYKGCHPGEIVMNRMQAWSGLFAIANHGGLVSPDYAVFRVNPGVLPAFALARVTAPDAVTQFAQASKGVGSGFNRLYSDQLGAVPVTLPPVEEQAAIVKYLAHAHRRIDHAIAAKRKLIALLEEQKRLLANDVVTQGLEQQVEMRVHTSRWYPHLPAAWRLTALGRVIHFAIDGPHFSPDYLDEGVPFLSARNIRPGAWRLDDVKYISRDDYESFGRRVEPRPGDVLYTKGGTTGVAVVVDLDFDFQVWVHVAVLRIKQDMVDARFLALALNSPRCYEQAQLETRGATNQDLGLCRMKRIELPLPTLNEQRAIVAHVDAESATADAAIDRASRGIELLREFRTRLTSDVVTGQLDVRHIAATLPDLDPGESDADVGAAEDDLVDEVAELLEDVAT